MSSINPLVQRYLAEFRAGLTRLGEQERRELCLEIESHIHEALGAGESLAVVLERLGPADRLARAYAAELLLQGHPQGSVGIRGFLSAASILAGTSLTSLAVVPLLATVAFGFGLCGPLVVLGGALSFAFPALINIPPGFWLPLPTVSALVMILGLCVSALSWGAYTLLRRYLSFLSTVIKRTIHPA